MHTTNVKLLVNESAANLFIKNKPKIEPNREIGRTPKIHELMQCVHRPNNKHI